MSVILSMESIGILGVDLMGRAKRRMQSFNLIDLISLAALNTSRSRVFLIRLRDTRETPIL